MWKIALFFNKGYIHRDNKFFWLVDGSICILFFVEEYLTKIHFKALGSSLLWLGAWTCIKYTHPKVLGVEVFEIGYLGWKVENTSIELLKPSTLDRFRLFKCVAIRSALAQKDFGTCLWNNKARVIARRCQFFPFSHIIFLGCVNTWWLMNDSFVKMRW